MQAEAEKRIGVAAPCQISAVPERLQWRYSPLDAEVVCPTEVLETIRREAVEGLSRLSRGGLETGGILLGRRTDRSMAIVGALPIECEHKLGPLFILSAADEKALEAALTSDKLGALQPVALYVSHSRRGFAVAETDAKILDRVIPGPWQLVLVVMPAKVGPCRAGFFIRGAVERSFVCVHELSLSPIERRPVTLPGFEPAAPATSLAPITPAVHNRAPINFATSALKRAYSLLRQEYKRWQQRQWSMPATVALLLLCVFAGGLWVRGRTMPAPAVPMHVSDLGSKLRIEWDPAHRAVRAASAALLEIRDGRRDPISLPITRTALDNGSALYVPQSDNVEVRLKMMQGRRATSESVIYYINPSRQSAAAPVIAPVEAPVAPLAAPPPAPAETADAPPVQRRAPPREKLPARVFQMPETPATTDAGQLASINLPDIPDIHASPAAALPLANGSSIVSLLAPQAHIVGPPQLRTGRLIWTGALRKNAVLSITASGASAGVLNGRLPGVPVKISLQPAELVDGGIAVYSRDVVRSGAGEPPSAWNGWNVAVYHDWDPKRIGEVDVVEAPAAANNWKRLVVRNRNRNVSVLVVNWQRLPGQ